MTNDELKEKIIYQTTPAYMSKIGDMVYNGILEHIPSYYEGGATGLLDCIIKRYGGRFYVPFRLGYAGFSHRFYLSYDYYNSEYNVIELADSQLSEEYLVKDSDIHGMILAFVNFIEAHLEKWG
ncbi:hypothetical protein [Streptococcus sp. zg-JUN1979]|uniref:hypothetical protein n=1 Tax=Streptococcus sp. zg-JUN1979 TaxID=3391450 RepID=UPI0039A75F6D